MSTTTLIAVAAFAYPPFYARVICRLRWSSRSFGRWAYCGLSGAFTSAIFTAVPGGGDTWPVVAGFAASGLTGLVLWWLSRRKRKRSLRPIGHKARARLAALVRNMPRPGPALRPVPQGSSS